MIEIFPCPLFHSIYATASVFIPNSLVSMLHMETFFPGKVETYAVLQVNSSHIEHMFSVFFYFINEIGVVSNNSETLF